MNLRPVLAAAVVLSLATATVALASGARLSAPSRAHVRQVVKATASNLKPGRYALTLASDETLMHMACVARVGRKHLAVDGVVRLQGRIPRRLTCYENDSVKLGTVHVTPGHYHLIVAVPDGPSGFNAQNSFARKAIRITRH